MEAGGTVIERVGLLGLGLLGSAVASRLVPAGYALSGFDIDPEASHRAGETGVRVAASGAEAVAGGPLTISCLPDGPAVHAALRHGVAEALAPGSVLIDLTTCSPEEARETSRLLAARGVAVLDAPVSGSSAQVRAGEALLLVGGEPETFERCRNVLAAISARSLYLGPSGSGATAKLVTNLVLGLNRLALAEGLVLAEQAGLDPAAALEVLRQSAAYSRAMDAKGPRMVERRYEPDARLRQHLKDVELILALGRETGAELPVSALHRQLLESAMALGLGDADNAAIVEALRQASAGRSQDPLDRGGYGGTSSGHPV